MDFEDKLSELEECDPVAGLVDSIKTAQICESDGEDFKANILDALKEAKKLIIRLNELIDGR